MLHQYHLYFDWAPKREPIHGIALVEDPYEVMGLAESEHFPRGLPEDTPVRLVVIPFAPPEGPSGLFRNEEPMGDSTVELYLNPEVAEHFIGKPHPERG